jgi:2'-5' RNA ligase
LRSFIAIELPESIQSALSDIQTDFKKSDVDVRWVRPENIHLTLKFLGTIEESMVRSITDVLKKASGSYGTFTLTLSGVGVFPNVRSPRVMWVGTNESSVLTDLQADIENGLASLGFEREKRKYTAHLTLGRFKSSRGKRALKEKVETYRERVPGSFDVGTISLMKSDRGPAGAKYTRVAEVRLGKDENRQFEI